MFKSDFCLVMTNEQYFHTIKESKDLTWVNKNLTFLHKHTLFWEINIVDFYIWSKKRKVTYYVLGIFVITINKYVIAATSLFRAEFSKNMISRFMTTFVTFWVVSASN